MNTNGLEFLPAFLTSLSIGLLMGLERERNPAARAGLRTFALVALLGTLLALLAEKTAAPWLIAVGLALVGTFIVAAYIKSPPEGDPGTTTVAALLMCYCLGAAIWYDYTTLAIIIAVVSTLLLYFKPELTQISQNMTRGELLSILQFAALTFVVLPVLPNEDIGPYRAFNPRHIWTMVVLISGVSLAGYLALKLLGRRWGAPVLGLFGGLVSSTATTLVYARHARGHADFVPLAVSVIVLANLVVLARLLIMIGIVAPALLAEVAPILGGGLVVGATTLLLRRRAYAGAQELPIPEIQNPTEVRAALTFGGLYGAVLFLTAALADFVGSRGVYAMALVSGLTDVDSITLSSLHLFELGTLESSQVAITVALAVLANMLFKSGMIFFTGGGDLLRRCAPGLGGVAIGIGIVLVIVA